LKHVSNLRSISVELAGGLGNQLFMYFAGHYMARKLGIGLRIFLHNSLVDSFQVGKGLSSFKGLWSEELGSSASIGKSPLTFRLRWLVSAWLIRLGVKRSTAERISQSFESKVIGEDPAIVRVKEGYLVRGYFQTRTYFLSVRETFADNAFQLSNTTLWHKQLTAEAKSINPIAMHVRRGDYLDPSNAFIGTLSTGYFVQALQHLRQDQTLAEKEIWVFSDDIAHTQREFAGKLPGKIRWISNPVDSVESEALLVMGSCGALVMSNSTFSWWAAAIGSPSRVIAPRKWFKSAEDPAGILMPEWETLDSEWL
jgi:hypothetical protein